MAKTFIVAAALTAGALAACAPSESDAYLASKSDTVLQTKVLRGQGICLSGDANAVYTINNIYDFWLIEARSAKTSESVSIAVSRHPDVKSDIRFDNREYRSRLKKPKLLRVGEGDILLIPNDLTSPYIHIYGGAPADREAALELVTFCKP